MKSFLEPQSVAIVGISRKSGPGAYNLMENMIRFGYQGRIYPVNPQAREILGVKAYRQVKEIGHRIDLAVITTPREVALKVLRQCAEAGVRGAIVVSQGFADADKQGRALQKEMVSLARGSGMRILGPNTLGVVNYFQRFTTSFMPLEEECAPVGLVCQSGIFFVGASNLVGPLGKGIDLGNACDVGFREALEAFALDPDIRVITVHMEGIQRGREFLETAARVARRKPVVVLKTGRSESAARAAASHTGSLTGDFHVHRAALRQAGLLVVEASQWMRPAVKTLLYLPPMRGNRVAVITFTGGGAIMAVDILEQNGLRLAPLSRKTLEPIARLSPSWLPVGNPVDIWPAVMRHGVEKVYSTALRAVLRDPQVDAALCIALAPRLPEFSFLDASGALNRVLLEEDLGKPVVAWLYGPNVKEVGEGFEKERRILVYQTLERAAWALSLLKGRPPLQPG